MSGSFSRFPHPVNRGVPADLVVGTTQVAWDRSVRSTLRCVCLFRLRLRDQTQQGGRCENRQSDHPDQWLHRILPRSLLCHGGLFAEICQRAMKWDECAISAFE